MASKFLFTDYATKLHRLTFTSCYILSENNTIRAIVCTTSIIQPEVGFCLLIDRSAVVMLISSAIAIIAGLLNITWHFSSVVSNFLLVPETADNIP